MKNILVLGDSMLDVYHYVRTVRKSQESDCPVYDRAFDDSYRLGGAANVAANVRALTDGLDDEFLVTFSGIAGPEVTSLLSRSGVSTCILNPTSGEQIRKNRFVEDDKIIFRFDELNRYSRYDVGLFEKFVKRLIVRRHYDCILISDYDRGTITEEIAYLSRKATNVLIVDSKRSDISMFEGSTVLNINEIEYELLCASGQDPQNMFDHTIVTLGDEGSMMVNRGDDHVYIKRVKKIDPIDVTGCGDTFTATLAVALSIGKNIGSAIDFANRAAGIAVTRFGTSIVSGREVWDL